MNKVKRISATIALILIVSMNLILLISAIFASEKAPGLFLASIFSTVVIPIMIYGFFTIYKMVHKNDQPTDTDATKNSDGSDSTKL